MRIEQVYVKDDKKIIGLEGLQKLSDEGDVIAAFLLGECILTGFETSIDERLSFECYNMAARAGYVPAMIRLSACYKDGHGVEPDFYAAERWARAADECGELEAKDLCKQIYLNTIGNHKPDLDAYIEYLYEKQSDRNPQNKNKICKKILQNIIAESTRHTNSIDVDKINENDIEAFRRLNDLNYNHDSMVSVSEMTDANVNQKIDELFKKLKTDNRDDIVLICKMLIAYSQNRLKVDGIRGEISDGSEYKKVVAQLCNVLRRIQENKVEVEGKYNIPQDGQDQECEKEVWNHLNDDNQEKGGSVTTLCNGIYELEGIIESCGKLGDIKGDLSDIERNIRKYKGVRNNKLTWLEKAAVDYDARFERSIDVNIYIDSIVTIYDSLQTSEINDYYSEYANDASKLKSLWHIVEEGYTFKISELWGRKIELRILEIEDATVASIYEENKDDYDRMEVLYFGLTKQTSPYDSLEIKTVEKWKGLVADRIKELQEYKLQELCENIEERDHHKLIEVLCSIEHYKFYDYIYKEYLSIVQKRIDEVEREELDILCKDIENRSSLEYKEIIDQIYRKGFKCENTNPYIKKLELLYAKADIFERFERAQASYDLMIELDEYIVKNYNLDIYKEWEKCIREKIVELQDIESKELLESLDKSSQEVIVESDKKLKIYDFDKEIYSKYKKLLDDIEVCFLNERCKCVDSLSSNDAKEMYAEISNIEYDREILDPFLDRIKKQIEKATLVETCDDNILEELDMDELNQRISDIHFSELDNSTKEKIASRIKRYMRLIEEGKDKKTKDIMVIVEGGLENKKLSELLAIEKRIEENGRILGDKREEVLLDIKENISRIHNIQDNIDGHLLEYNDKDCEDAEALLVRNDLGTAISAYIEKINVQRRFLCMNHENIEELLEVYNYASGKTSTDIREKYLNIIRKLYYDMMKTKLKDINVKNPWDIIHVGMGEKYFDAVCKEGYLRIYNYDKEIPLVVFKQVGIVITNNQLYIRDHSVSISGVKECYIKKNLFYRTIVINHADCGYIELNFQQDKETVQEYCRIIEMTIHAIVDKPKYIPYNNTHISMTKNDTTLITQGVVWDCLICGRKGNTGKFCGECGKIYHVYEEKWICSCGTANKGNFCRTCGGRKDENSKENTQRSELIFCTYCGKSIKRVVKFCNYCGKENKYGEKKREV